VKRRRPKAAGVCAGRNSVRSGALPTPQLTKRKAPGCGSGGFWFLRALLRGDDPEALALRPSHNLRAFVAVSGAPLASPKPGVRLGCKVDGL
jgi:hypothetical protein